MAQTQAAAGGAISWAHTLPVVTDGQIGRYPASPALTRPLGEATGSDSWKRPSSQSDNSNGVSRPMLGAWIRAAEHCHTRCVALEHVVGFRRHSHRAGRDGTCRLAHVDVTGLTDDEVLELNEAAQRLRTLADGVCVRAASALDTSGAWAPEGAKSPAAWLQWRCRIQRGRAVTFRRCARELRTMSATEVALLAGQITSSTCDSSSTPSAVSGGVHRRRGPPRGCRRPAAGGPVREGHRLLEAPPRTRPHRADGSGGVRGREASVSRTMDDSWSWTRCSIRSAAPSSGANWSAWTGALGSRLGRRQGAGG